MATNYNEVEVKKPEQKEKEQDEAVVVEQKSFEATPAVKEEKVEPRKSIFQRITYALLDSKGIQKKLKDTANRVVDDVIIPRFFDLLHDAAVDSVDSIFNRKTSTPKSYSTGGRRYTDYSNNYRRVQSKPAAYKDLKEAWFSPDDPTDYRERERCRRDADEFANWVVYRIRNNGVLKVSEYYDRLGWQTSYIDNTFGWYSVDDITVEQMKDGYIVRMPDPEALRR